MIGGLGVGGYIGNVVIGKEKVEKLMIAVLRILKGLMHLVQNSSTRRDSLQFKEVNSKLICRHIILLRVVVMIWARYSKKTVEAI